MEEPQNISAARAHFQARRLAEAEAICRALLARNPRDAEALHVLGMIAGMAGHREAAEPILRQAAAIKPDSAEIVSALGTALFQLDRFAEARHVYERALQLNANQFVARHNLAVIHQRAGDIPAAAEDFRKATAIAPDNALARLNLGALLRDLGALRESTEQLRQAILLDPNLAHAHMQLAWNALLQGDFTGGWPGYEWRWRVPGVRLPQFPQSIWDGSKLSGRTIMLHSEQGLGDSIQFVRYAALLARQGAKVIVYSPAILRELLATSPGVTHAASDLRSLPPFDVWCPMISLPLRFGTDLTSIPANTPYLSADPVRVSAWRDRMSNDPTGLKVGLCWAGNRGNFNDVNRSIPAEMLLPLRGIPNVVLYSLQIGPDAVAGRTLGLIDRTSSIADFSDSSALVTQLDLVITVDTAVAHLAGALSKPVWLLLPFAPDWRWLLDRHDSPWYPSMRLLRKKPLEPWPPLIEKVAEALRERV
jgi:Flp pilus assembly protein TadD